MDLDLTAAFMLILVAFAVGDFVSTVTKAFVPSIFVAAVLFLVGYWTIWPEDIATRAGFSNELMVLSSYLILVNMGTSISVRQLIDSWKTVVLALISMGGLVAMIFIVGVPTIGRQAALVASPVLAGGIQGAIIMQTAAEAKGLYDLVTLAALVLVVQGFVGYPLTSISLKKEGEDLLKIYRSGDSEQIQKLLGSTGQASGATVERSIVPERFRTNATYLLQSAFLAFLAVRVGNLSGGRIPVTILCLLFGILGTEIGFVDSRPVNKSYSMGFITIANLVRALGGLSSATPEMVGGLLVPLLIVVVSGVLGLFVVSQLLGGFFGYSKPYSFALALNCLLGFPPNMIITNDVARAISDTEEEESFLNDAMLPNMLIAGFATVTIGSVVLASIFARMI